MDIHAEDFDAMFHVLDQDRSGDIQYDEFAEQLQKMKNNDKHTMLVFIRYYVMELVRESNNILREIAEDTKLTRDEIIEHIKTQNHRHDDFTNQIKLQQSSSSDRSPDSDSFCKSPSALKDSQKSIQSQLDSSAATKLQLSEIHASIEKDISW